MRLLGKGECLCNFMEKTTDVVMLQRQVLKQLNCQDKSQYSFKDKCQGQHQCFMNTSVKCDVKTQRSNKLCYKTKTSNQKKKKMSGKRSHSRRRKLKVEHVPQLGLSIQSKNPTHPKVPTGSDPKIGRPDQVTGRRRVICSKNRFRWVGLGFPPQNPKKPNPTDVLRISSKNFQNPARFSRIRPQISRFRL